MKNNVFLFVIILIVVNEIVAPPVDPKKTDSGSEQTQQAVDPDDLGLEYGRYLQQVIQILEEDKDFAKKLENVSADAIKSGKIAHELEFVNHNIRTKLDEVKRIELDRLRALIRVQQSDIGAFRSEDPRLNPPPAIRDKRFRLPHHLDIKNPNTFEIEDLKKLIKTASKDLDEINEKRKEEFKHYEMEKEHKYREELKRMNEEERKVAEAKHQEMVNKHKDHPQVHHPGSKQQLEQVWEEVDHLPKDEFDPKTFFRMHDINGDGFLDEEEVKALVALEVRKMYNISNEEDDPIEMQEEFSRMEEHIFKEADKNSDRLISMNEFLDMTRKPDFEQDPGWKGLDEEQIFTPEELMEYERQLAAQAGYHPNMPYQGGYPQEHYPQGGYPPNQGGYPPNQGGYPPNQQYAYQPVQGVPPSNQGVQFQGLPQQQGQQGGLPHPSQATGQQPHPGQAMGQPPHPGPPMGQPPHPGPPMGQPPHPGQPMGQPPHPGQPMGQPPHPGQPMGAPHYPSQYAPAGGANQPQYGIPPNQAPVTGAPVPNNQLNQGLPQAAGGAGANTQLPVQPQVAQGGNAHQAAQGPK